MNNLNYTSVSSDYFSASSESSSFNSLENSTDNIIPPVFSSFYNNPCLKDVQAFYANELPISPPDPITSPAILTPSSVLPPSLLFDPRCFFVPEELLPPKKRICSPSSSSTTLPNLSRNQTCDLISPSSSVYTPTPPQIFEIGKCSVRMHLKHHEKKVKDILDYLDELSFHRIEKMEEGHIDRMIIRRNSDELKIELERISLKAQAASMASASNPNRNTGPTRTSIVKTGNYKEFVSCQPFYFNGMEGAVNLIRWFELTESNSYAQPIGIDQANRITWTELKRLLTNKYCPRTEVKKMEDEFYNLVVKGNDLKTYIRRFQELAVLCPNMVPNAEKLMEVFISGLPRSIEGNVTASKPQTLEKAINIAQRLMDQIIKCDFVQETNNHK
ncbi:reverse transcriptase domain-containing protein [Tanacetum coccineum]